MVKFIVLLGLGVLLLSGCSSQEQDRARNLALDQQRCQPYKALSGESAYLTCMQLAEQRRAREEQEEASYDWQSAPVNLMGAFH